MDLEGDNGLDSVANFFLSWNRIELDEEASVPGGIVDGETVYLDSVMYNYNPIFNQLGRIDSEDSLYWFVAPTNKIWKENIDLYRSYFKVWKKTAILYRTSILNSCSCTVRSLM